MRSLFLLNKVASRRSSRSFESDSSSLSTRPTSEEWDNNNNTTTINKSKNINRSSHRRTISSTMEDQYFQSSSSTTTSSYTASTTSTKSSRTNMTTSSASSTTTTSPSKAAPSSPPSSRPSSRQVRKRSSFFSTPKKPFHRHHYSEDTTSSLRSTNSSRLANHAIEEEPEEQLHFSFSKMYRMNPRIRKTPSRLQMHGASSSVDEDAPDSRAPSRQEIPHSRSTPNFHKLLRQDSNPKLRGKPISSPFHFKHLSHVDSHDVSSINKSNVVELEKDWKRAIRQPTPSPTTPNQQRPSVPPTPQSAKFNRLPLRTDGLMPSPSLESAYSPVESMADLNRSSTRSIESLTNLFPSHLSPPPRTSSRLALRGAFEDSTPRESMIRESIIILQGTDDLPSPPISPRRRSSFVPHHHPDTLEEVPDEEDEVVSPLSPPPRSNTSHSHHRSLSGARPGTSSSQDSASSGKKLRTFKSSPDIVVNNNLLVPPTAIRPASQASETLGLSIGNGVTVPLPPVLEQPPAVKKRLSKTPAAAKVTASSQADASADFEASWEDDIDWSYDNEPSDAEDEASSTRDSGPAAAVGDLASLFPNPPISKSSSAPTSASASAVNLTTLVSTPPPTQALPPLPNPLSPVGSPPPASHIGIADGGFGVFDESDYDYASKVPHQEKMKMRAAKSAHHIRSLSSFSSLPEGHMRKRYKNPQFQEFPSLNEKEELPASTFRRIPAGPREVAIPPASYFEKEIELQGRRSRAASNATCATLVSDTDTALASDIDALLTPPHSNHNSAESTFLSKHAKSLRFSGKDQHTSILSPGVVVVGSEGVQALPASLRPDADFNFF